MAPHRPIDEAKLKTLAAQIVAYEKEPTPEHFRAITQFIVNGLALNKATIESMGIGYKTITHNATMGNQVREDDRNRIVTGLKTWAEKHIGPIKAADFTHG